eukprot:750795-Hanusia_phi.AAC.5
MNRGIQDQLDSHKATQELGDRNRRKRHVGLVEIGGRQNEGVSGENEARRLGVSDIRFLPNLMRSEGGRRG